MVKMTSAEAQNQFGKLLDTAQREPVAITRHGRTADFVVSPQDMQNCLTLPKRPTKLSMISWPGGRKPGT